MRRPVPAAVLVCCEQEQGRSKGISLYSQGKACTRRQVVAVYLSRSRIQHQQKLMLADLVGDWKIILAELTVDALTGT